MRLSKWQGNLYLPAEESAQAVKSQVDTKIFKILYWSISSAISFNPTSIFGSKESLFM
jgi:hypothetical protein